MKRKNNDLIEVFDFERSSLTPSCFNRFQETLILPVMINIVFLTNEDDRNITKGLIFFNFKNYLFGIYNKQNWGLNRQGTVCITTQVEKD
jgi:hypothetical protein